MNATRANQTVQWRPRHTMPGVVLAVALSDALLAGLRAVLTSESRLFVAIDFRDAERLLPSLPFACLVFAVPGPGDATFASSFTRLHKLFPHVEALPIFVQDVSDPVSLLDIGLHGVSELISVTRKVDGDALRRGLWQCHSESVGKRLWVTANLRVPESLVPVLKAALRHAHEPITGARLAIAAGMHERTLRKYCTNEKLPSPQWIIGWARLLIASHYLDEPGRTVERIAELLEYPSPTALRNQLRRYTGHTATKLRSLGAVWQVARSIERAVRDRNGGEPDEPTAPPTLSLIA